MAIQIRENPKNPKKKQYRYRTYYKDIFGVNKQKNGAWRDTKKEAEYDQNRFLATTMEGSIETAKVNDIAYDWLEYSKTQNTKKTYEEKVYIMETFILPVFGKMKASDVTATHIKNWFHSDLLKHGIKSTKDGDKRVEYTVDYQNKILSMLSTMFKHGMLFHGLKLNPCTQVARMKKPFSQKKEMVVYDLEEFNLFYSLLDCDKTYKAFFRLLFFTGLRFSEAQGLQWSDLKGNRLNISKQWNERQKEFVGLKTDTSYRVVDIDKKTMEVLLELKEFYKQYEGFKDSWFMFGGTRPIPKKTVENIKNRVIERNNLKYLRIHDFRHSHASFLIDRGGEDAITAVSKRLGHADVYMTLKRYTHLMKSSQDKLLKIIEEME